MKSKIWIVAVTMAVLASCGPSYRVTNRSGWANVPVSMQNTFSSQYPGATDVTWSRYDAVNAPIDWDLAGWPALTQGDYVVTFAMDNNNYYAWYDANGNWLGSTYSISDYKSLPEAVNTMISDKYPGYSIASVNREIRKDRLAYEIGLTNGDSKIKLLADESGNIIKEKKIEK